MTTQTTPNSTKQYETIKLGIDAHAQWYHVSRQVDGATPQPVQKMTFEELLLFVARQQKLAGQVYTCYEAGPFGYHLHRRLAAMGVTNFVVQPQDWDDRGKGVKNDRLDALALCQRLDRYVRGNKKAFSIVRVPTEEEERERAMSRQRQQLVRERQRLAAMGRSLLAMHNIHVTGRWWKAKAWARVKAQAPGWVVERLPERLALGSDTLEQNAPISAGLGRLRALAGESIRSQLDSAAKIAKMRDDLRKFRDVEREMDATASGPSDTKAKEEKLSALLMQLGAIKVGYDAKLKTATSDRLMSSEKVSLSFAYWQLVSVSQTQSSANFQLLRDTVKPNLAHPTAKLFKEVDDELAKTVANLAEQVKGTFNEKDREELTQLDSYLEDFGDRRRIYEVRYRTYQDAGDASKTHKTDDFIGKSWAAYGAVVKEIQGQREQLPRIQLKLSNPAAKDSPGIENTCRILLDVAKARRLSALANEYLRQTAQKFDANFFEPFVSDTGRKFSMTKAERLAANSLIDMWKLDREAPDFASVDPAIKARLTSVFCQFDAMKAAAAAYDDYFDKMNGLKARVTFRSQNSYKWKTANGLDIFNASEFSATVKFGEKLSIILKDTAQQPFEGSVTIDTADEGEQSVRSGGARLKFEVKHIGEKPRSLTGLPKAPSKPAISEKLR